ncbi:amino acid--tRNA ligase-related protein [Treponema parvum]|uniref:amino acid--tRNA ligase-related protein n=1 Tax=Treponema parvum TaxID=138851 RepID=UPI001AEC2E3A|nr:amino acid--tRNA ligase-related protein [Treponema parvum]QTQ16640.1 LysR family transcriptional regulator [Treponema parvum]
MDLEMLKLRAVTIQRVRDFFIKKGFLELDTPALSTTLIPESCIEIFKTEYIEPWSGISRQLYLVPSPEIYMKRVIAQHKTNVFQISKCYRNIESMGRIHNPEFTMLEYYSMDADYKISAKLTEELIKHLLPPIKSEKDNWNFIRPPFVYMTMDEAFEKFAGFKLSDAQEQSDLAYHARNMGIAEPADNPFENRSWKDLFELIFVQCVEQKLSEGKATVIMNYPVQVPCLAKDIPAEQGGKVLWKERWELYANGMEIANCYTEETSPEKVRLFFENESKIKARHAKVKHMVDAGYWKIFKNFPECSGVAMGMDRLIALISGHKAISPVLPFML